MFKRVIRKSIVSINISKYKKEEKLHCYNIKILSRLEQNKYSKTEE